MPCRLIVDTPKQSSWATRRTGSPLAVPVSVPVLVSDTSQHITAHHTSHTSRRSLAHTSQCSLAHTSLCPLSPSQCPLSPHSAHSPAGLSLTHTHTRALAQFAPACSPHATDITPHGQSLCTSSVLLDRLCSPSPPSPHPHTVGRGAIQSFFGCWPAAVPL